MKQRMVQLAWLLLVIGMLRTTAADAPAVRAWLDRDTMQLGETVTLNVEVQGKAAAKPDFDALDQDFNRIGTQSSQQVNIVNGRASAKTLWAVGLEPKHAGRIAIPALAIGAAGTAPLTLTVLPAPAGAQGKPGDDVFLEVTAEPLVPWVQQQVRYTVKLYYAMDLTQGNLDDPHASGLVVQKLGQDADYLATVGGRRYHVVERHYALTPEQSGVIDIPALAFRGNALDASDPTGFFGGGRRVTARSDAIVLDVKPKPAGWGDDPWLPTASLTLSDESEVPAQVHVGDPVTRTIRLQAQGLGFAQLPELKLAAPADAEIYPDQPQLKTRDDGTWLYGERTRKFAFVATRPGTLTLPALGVRWWDTVRDRSETATLPARTVEVLPAPATLTTGVNAGATTGTANAVPSTSTVVPPAPALAIGAATTDRMIGDIRVRIWQLMTAIGFLLWLITLTLYWRTRRPALPASPAAPRSIASGDGHAAFARACALGDLAGAERALVAWARGERPSLNNLGELAGQLIDPAQRDALVELQRVRYAGANGDGLAGRLPGAFKSGIAWANPARPRAASPALPALYPGERG